MKKLLIFLLSIISVFSIAFGLVGCEHTCEYIDIKVDPTCTTHGYIKHECQKCFDYYKTDYVNALGHEMGEWEEYRAPTTLIEGLNRRSCTRKGCKFYEEKEIPIVEVEYELSEDKSFYSVVKIGNLTHGQVSIPSKYNGLPVKEIKSGAASWNRSIVKLEIAEGVEVIGAGAFQLCSKLTEVILPDTIKRIDSYAFSGCSLITKINVPNDLVSMGVGAFIWRNIESQCLVEDGIKYLGSQSNPYIIAVSLATDSENVVVKEGTRFINESLFDKNVNIKTLTLPSTLLTIGTSAMFKMENLTTINFGGTKADWQNIKREVVAELFTYYTVHCTDGDIVKTAD